MSPETLSKMFVDRCMHELHSRGMASDILSSNRVFVEIIAAGLKEVIENLQKSESAHI